MHLDREWPAFFSFLHDPSIDATNWRAEQAIRPAVLTRKVNGGGNRSVAGAMSQHILASALRAAHQRDLDGVEIPADVLRAPPPVVSPALFSRASPR